MRRLIKRWNLNTISEGCEKVIYYSHIHTILCLHTLLVHHNNNFTIFAIVSQSSFRLDCRIESLDRSLRASYTKNPVSAHTSLSYRWLFCGRSQTLQKYTGNPRTGTNCVWGLDNRIVMHHKFLAWDTRMKVWNYQFHNFDTKSNVVQISNPLSICYHAATHTHSLGKKDFFFVSNFHRHGGVAKQHRKQKTQLSSLEDKSSPEKKICSSQCRL